MFLYYFPGVASVNKKNMDGVLADCGLDRVLDGTHPQCHQTPAAPDGTAQTGCVCAFHPTAFFESVPLSLSPKEQTWRKCAGGKFWLGYWNGVKPTPEDLARIELIMGYCVPAGDGNTWIFPMALAWDGTNKFPKQATWGEDGKIIREVIPKYLEFSSRVRTLATSFYDTGDWGISEDEKLEYAVESLNLNYRVGKYELSMLGVFSPEETVVNNVLFALIDQPQWAEKKRALSAESDSQDGQAE